MEPLESRTLLTLTPQLVSDIDPYGVHISGPIVTVGNVAYFPGENGMAAGAELWRSDGTVEGTVQVKDIRPGAADSLIENLVNVNGTLFFTATDGDNGVELWKSDGTANGTAMVRDIFTGLGNSSFPQSLLNINGTLFFSAQDGINGRELWKSDGTADNTVMVKDIQPGSGASQASFLTNLNGTLIFSANDGATGFELWKSDGTPNGTTQLKNISPGINGSFPTELTVVGGSVFFRADDGTNGAELWKTNGTTTGTVLVKDILNDDKLGNSSAPSGLIDVNGTLFFSALDDKNGVELWKSDGTPGGTTLVKNIRPSGASSTPEWLTNVNGTLFFRANDGTNGVELWKSDGTASGTVLVKDIQAAGSSTPTELTVVGSRVYFQANNGVHGVELWRSDGTSVGTIMLKDVGVGSDSSNPHFLANLNGSLLFGVDTERGTTLWRSDHTALGTVQFPQPARYSNPGSITALGNTVLFAADTVGLGRGLWKTDGTDAGTVLLKVMEQDGGTRHPDLVTVMNGTLYFIVRGRISDDLWKTDGSLGGTVEVGHISSGTVLELVSNTDPRTALIYMCDDSNRLFVYRDDGSFSAVLAGSFGAVSDLTPLGFGLLYREVNNLYYWDGAPGSLLLRLVGHLDIEPGFIVPGSLNKALRGI